MKYFDKKHLLMDSFETFWDSWWNDFEADKSNYKKSETLIFWEQIGDFKRDKYPVFVEELKSWLVNLKIDDSWSNTIIRNVPVWKEQAILDDYLGKVWIDNFFKNNVFVYNPTKK